MPSYCSECRSVEQDFREPNEQELFEMSLDPDQYEKLSSRDQRDLLICTQCGEPGTYRVAPEHDDFDYER